MAARSSCSRPSFNRHRYGAAVVSDGILYPANVVGCNPPHTQLEHVCRKPGEPRKLICFDAGQWLESMDSAVYGVREFMRPAQRVLPSTPRLRLPRQSLPCANGFGTKGTSEAELRYVLIVPEPRTISFPTIRFRGTLEDDTAGGRWPGALPSPLRHQNWKPPAPRLRRQFLPVAAG
jgi:hypothetical protein